MVAWGIFGGLSPWGSRLGVATGILFFGVLPGLILLYMKYKGRVAALYLPERQQRQGMLLWGSVWYFAAFALLWILESAGPLLAAGAVFWVNALAVWLINRWWKISIHATGVAGGVGLLHFFWGPGWASVLLVVPLLAVMWARLHLRAHTPAQVLAGTLLGALSATWLAAWAV